MSIRALIVDDERLARSRLSRLLAGFPDIEIVAEARNGREGLQRITEKNPDLIFLDIQMPGLTGFEMLEHLDRPPFIVFTTAYDAYALKAFEANAVDYLLKPIETEALERALTKVRQIAQNRSSRDVDLSGLLAALKGREKVIRRFSVRLGERILIIPEEEIHYFRAEEKCTFLRTDKEDHIIAFTLKELEERLDPDRFLRVHRGFIVSLDHVAGIHRWFKGRLKLKMKDNREIIVSRHYVRDFKARIHLV